MQVDLFYLLCVGIPLALMFHSFVTNPLENKKMETEEKSSDNYKTVDAKMELNEDKFIDKVQKEKPSKKDIMVIEAATGLQLRKVILKNKISLNEANSKYYFSISEKGVMTDFYNQKRKSDLELFVIAGEDLEEWGVYIDKLRLSNSSLGLNDLSSFSD